MLRVIDKAMSGQGCCFVVAMDDTGMCSALHGGGRDLTYMLCAALLKERDLLDVVRGALLTMRDHLQSLGDATKGVTAEA